MSGGEVPEGCSGHIWGQGGQMLKRSPLRPLWPYRGLGRPDTQNEALKPISGGGERDSPLTDVKGTVEITTLPLVRNATRLRQQAVEAKSPPGRFV